MKDDDIREDDSGKNVDVEDFVDENEDEDYCLPVDLQTNVYEVISPSIAPFHGVYIQTEGI